MDRVLVVAAHPDDDILGCGGTVALLTSRGRDVRVQFLADGVGSRADRPQHADERKDDARRALAIVGATDVGFAGFPDNAMDTVPLLDICKTVAQTVAEFRPDTVLTHSLSDLNIDHRLTAEAVLVAARPHPESPVQRVLNFEVPSATGWRPAADAFDPRFHVDVTGTRDAKLAALQEYEVEMRPWPHARSLEAVDALMRWRGAMVGVEAAEAFEIALWIHREGDGVGDG